ncbi:hypothetical protein A6A06_01190 [Streptomyces sp. CB02923]|uniref:hypothetical protein n=1 Tax=Streptomyces sp. CB02923 TaxID=1718985 RepID=UPI00093AD2D2|nr:hypothetical protein [Streptomyces sp. CB02923]OKI09356.1 hypothetical protein A6A06_01190 [Streptomyces sp. CB02923]
MKLREAPPSERRTRVTAPDGARSPWRFSPGPAAVAPDRQALDLLANGAGDEGLVAQGLCPNKQVARFTISALGVALSGGQHISRPRLIHLAVVRELCTVPPAVAATIPLAQRCLLTALAAGLALRQFAVASALTMAEAQELRVLMRASLRARSDEHAVFRGHQVRVLPRQEDLIVEPFPAQAGQAA